MMSRTQNRKFVVNTANMSGVYGKCTATRIDFRFKLENLLAAPMFDYAVTRNDAQLGVDFLIWMKRQRFSKQRMVAFRVTKQLKGVELHGTVEVQFSKVDNVGECFHYESRNFKDMDLGCSMTGELPLGPFFDTTDFVVSIRVRSYDIGNLHTANLVCDRDVTPSPHISVAPFDVFLTLKEANSTSTSSPSASFFAKDPRLRDLLSTKDGKLGIYTHKRLLCGVSEVFSAMFEGTTKMQEQQTNVVEMAPISSGISCLSPELLCFFVALLHDPLLDISHHNDSVYWFMYRVFGLHNKKRKPQQQPELQSSEEKTTKKVKKEQTTLKKEISIGVEDDEGDDDADACDTVEKQDEKELLARLNMADKARVDAIVLPLFDLLHQYRCLAALKQLEHIMLRSVCELTLHKYYRVAVLYKIPSLLTACAVFATDAMLDFQYDGGFATFATWSDDKHLLFSQFVEKALFVVDP